MVDGVTNAGVTTGGIPVPVVTGGPGGVPVPTGGDVTGLDVMIGNGCVVAGALDVAVV